MRRGVKLSLKVPSSRRPFVKRRKIAWTIKGCTVNPRSLSLPKTAKGKKAKVTVTFAGNSFVAPATLKKTIKIR